MPENIHLTDRYGTEDGAKPGDRCYSPAEDRVRGSTWGIRLIEGRLVED